MTINELKIDRWLNRKTNTEMKANKNIPNSLENWVWSISDINKNPDMFCIYLLVHNFLFACNVYKL